MHPVSLWPKALPPEVNQEYLIFKEDSHLSLFICRLFKAVPVKHSTQPCRGTWDPRLLYILQWLLEYWILEGYGGRTAVLLVHSFSLIGLIRINQVFKLGFKTSL